MSIKINCDTRTITSFSNDICSGEQLFSTEFTDHECIDIDEIGIQIIASCDGYQEISTPTPTAAPTEPTNAPTDSPTITGATRSPSKAPVTASPTKTPTKAPTKPTKLPSKAPSKTPSNAPSKTPSNAPSKAPVTSEPSKAPVTPAPSKAPVTAAPTKRTCAGIPRGCSKNEAGTCAGKSATWVVEGETGSCECASTDKASKVVFKLKVEATTVASFNSDECNLVDFFRGVYNKVYEKTKSSIVSDYPVEIQTAPVQSGSDVVVEFAVHGFLETSVADAVISYINTETASFVAAIEAAAANALGGDGVEISYVAGSASRVDNVSFCGCKDLIDNVGNGAISSIQSNYIAQAIVAGIVAFAANQ